MPREIIQTMSHRQGSNEPDSDSASSGRSSTVMQQLMAAGELAPVHLAFAETLRHIDPLSHPDVILAGVMASEQSGRGHVCLDLNTAGDIVFQSVGQAFGNGWPETDKWIETLQASPLVECRDSTDNADGLRRPLVLDVEHRRVYLARYWFYQQKLAARISERLRAESSPTNAALLASDIAELFPSRAAPSERGQCLAAAMAVDRRFSVISGGPGTGKTTTVARLLALRLQQELHRRNAGTVGSSHAETTRRAKSGRKTDARQMVLALTDELPDEADPDSPVAVSETAEHSGTGSTTGHGQPLLRVLLLAPTGKAAQRLTESLRRATTRLKVDPVVRKALMDSTPGTIHRILGTTSIPPERGGPFRHHAGHPLDADVVLVDEASMVDLGLMWRLFDAVRPDAQIILLGDRDQLASVEAGGVLSDLCGAVPDDEVRSLPAGIRQELARRTGLSDLSSRAQANDAGDAGSVLSSSVSMLRYSHRFTADSELGNLAALIRRGDADGAVDLLSAVTRKAAGSSGVGSLSSGRLIDRGTSAIDNVTGSVIWLDALIPDEPATTTDMVIRRAAVGYEHYLTLLRSQSTGSPEVLQALSDQRVLCAHREGSRGESAINRRIIERLARSGHLKPWPAMSPGRAVMVTRNDYALNLFNGDVGVVVDHPDGGAAVLFADESGAGCRHVPAAIVPQTQDCFAMTIHKSQGSEFHRVIVVLPDTISPLASRELLYTAITRVCDKVDPTTNSRVPGELLIAASEPVLRAAIQHSIRRSSGLRESIEARQ